MRIALGIFAIPISLLICSLLPRPVRAEDKWLEVRSTHFTVYTPASEKDGREIAEQLEQIRALFYAAFPQLRTDPAQPIAILAVKDEKGMTEFLPEQWQVKGHLRAAGFYQAGFDKHYVIVARMVSEHHPESEHR